jgi:DNA modification methylase
MDIHCLNSQELDGAMLFNGDCVEVTKQLPDRSIDYSVYSPPFSNVFVYSDSERDMGNCVNDDEFFDHYKFLIEEIYRLTRPGRLTSVHCSNLPMHKFKDGHIGIKDFRGDIIKAHIEKGWIYHSEVVIWKCPLIEATRTKALGLLYKQVQKDSTMSRQGMPDYIVTFKKYDPDHEDEISMVKKDPNEFSQQDWRNLASPVWMDINQTNVLNVREARDNADEKHICPLQLDVIERCLKLWTNPNDVVLSPFMGIGSEGYVSAQMGRRFIGIELKPIYFEKAIANIQSVKNQGVLFESAC